MSRRELFQEILEGLMPDGFDNDDYVHFQPPPTVQLSYPAIIYHKSKPHTLHADNILYRNKDCYTVMVIDPDPDSELPGKVARLPYASFDRSYTADQLNHDVYSVYF